MLQCKIATISRYQNTTLYGYMLNSEKLERLSTITDLGVGIDSILSWNKHKQKVVSKAYKMLGLSRRNLGYKVPQSLRENFIYH